MHKVLVSISTLLVACGSTMATPDGPPDRADATADTKIAQDAPDMLGPFSAPLRIAELDTPSGENQASATADQLAVVFASDRPGSLGANDIWVSTRATVSDAWRAPTNIVEINTADDDSRPWITADGLQLYFSRLPAGTTTRDLYVSVRPTRTSPWSAPILVPEFDTVASDYAISISADGLIAVIDSDRGGASGRDLYLATRSSNTAAWSVPQGIAAINSPGIEKGPALAADGLALYYISGAGGEDIYVSRRASRNDPFAAGTAVTELNTSAGENAVWVSNDEHDAIIGSTREGTTYDLFAAHR